MPYYKKNNILFIHIPKTGGQVIESQMVKFTEQTLLTGRPNSVLDPPYKKISLQHQLYTTIYKNRNKLKVNFNGIKIFTVVRNPYFRLISDLFWYGLIKKDYTSDMVFKIIKYNYLDRDDLDNHNIPQFKFVTDENGNLIDNIKIFKTEDLNDSNDELINFTGFNINIKRQNVNKNYDRYLNKESILLINSVYKKDFELFNYVMKL